MIMVMVPEMILENKRNFSHYLLRHFHHLIFIYLYTFIPSFPICVDSFYSLPVSFSFLIVRKEIPSTQYEVEQ